MGIDVEKLAGEHHGGPAEFLDDRRYRQPLAWSERSARIDWRGAEGAVEIDRTCGCLHRGRRCARREPRHRRPLDRAEAGYAQIDDLDLLLAGIVVAEGAQMRGVKRLDRAAHERRVDRAARRHE